MNSQGVLEVNFNLDTPVEETYKKLGTWMRFNGVSIREETPPTYIQCYWKGNIVGSDGNSLPLRPTDSLEPRIPFRYNLINDPLEKDITINIRPF